MPSKPNILIVGASGSGKSTSLERLLTGPRAKECAFLDFERKGLPFILDKTKLGFYAEPEDIHSADQAMKDAYKVPGINFMVYDSLSKYLDYAKENAQKVKTGWDVWNFYNEKVGQFIEFNKKTGKVMITTIHDEVVQMDTPDGGRVSRLRASVLGKQWEGKIEKEFLIVLFTFAKKDGNDMKHWFHTKTDGLQSAKTPMWLGLANPMSNDISVVVEKLVEKGQV